MPTSCHSVSGWVKPSLPLPAQVRVEFQAQGYLCQGEERGGAHWGQVKLSFWGGGEDAGVVKGDPRKDEMPARQDWAAWWRYLIKVRYYSRRGWGWFEVLWWEKGGGGGSVRWSGTCLGSCIQNAVLEMKVKKKEEEWLRKGKIGKN